MGCGCKKNKPKPTNTTVKTSSPVRTVNKPTSK